MSSNDSPASFAELGLPPSLLAAVSAVGYETPSPIQAKSIPLLLGGRDLLGQAQTGTGKTAAFALPLLARIDTAIDATQLLVLAPTRELAIQVAEAFQKYAHDLPGFHILPIYGGQSMGVQLKQLRRGAHVVVGTPGRVMDHLRRGSLKLDQLRAVVLDEADEMLRMGFIEDVEWILEQCPEGHQTALFSATMPAQIQAISRRYLKDPALVEIATKTATVDTIRQRYWLVEGLHKNDALTRLLEVEDFDAMIVFVRTRTMTAELAEKLAARGFASAALSGDMQQQQREATIERLKSGKLDIIVATDVAARGLDVPRISHVVNYDIPLDTEAYVHRVGRTGRAGREGNAILFVARRERYLLRAIERATRQQIEPMEMPSNEDLSERRVTQFKAEIEAALDGQPLDFFQAVVEQFQREHEVEMADVAAALAWMAQRELPLQLPKDPPRRDFRDQRERPDKRPGRTVGERPEGRGKGDFKRREPTPGLVPYRVEVGRAHGVEPRNLVGAIANESGLARDSIGRIRLFDEFSVVELPQRLPDEAFRILQGVWVCGRKLQLRPDRGPGGGPGGGSGSAPDRAHGGGQRGWHDRGPSAGNAGGGPFSAADRPRKGKPFKPGPGGKAARKHGD